MPKPPYGPYQQPLDALIHALQEQNWQMDGAPTFDDASTPEEIRAAGEYKARQDLYGLLSAEVEGKPPLAQAFAKLASAVYDLKERQEAYERAYDSVVLYIYHQLLAFPTQYGVPEPLPEKPKQNRGKLRAVRKPGESER